jgi:transposase
MVIRAKIVLAAANGQTNAVIAAELRMHIDTVRKWRRRFCQHGLDGLKDQSRSGRPRHFTAVQVLN